jgi:hypothetical protein
VVADPDLQMNVVGFVTGNPLEAGGLVSGRIALKNDCKDAPTFSVDLGPPSVANGKGLYSCLSAI